MHFRFHIYVLNKDDVSSSDNVVLCVMIICV